MVQLNRKAAAPAPNVLTDAGHNETETLKASYDEGNINFTFNSAIYAHATVKASLIDLQEHKCCFCEAKFTHVGYGDVEHFRPKGGWVQEDEAINSPGYYWLAYEWNNLMLSCEICNQRHKKNFFPLANPLQRALSHHDDLNLEQPLFIHPANENPEELIAFVDNIPVAINGNVRAIATIKKLQLARESLNEHRLSKLNPIRTLYLLTLEIPEINVELRGRAFDMVSQYIEEANNDSCEYASMLRCFFAQNPLPNI